MRTLPRSALAITAVGALSFSLLPGAANAGYGSGSPGARDNSPGQERATTRSDNLPNPIADKQLALRDRAIQLAMRGKRDVRTVAGSSVVRVGKGQYAEVARRATDRNPDEVLTFLVEFGKKHMEGTPVAQPGPVHNRIPRPDRKWNGSATDDNSTYWRENFNRGHYLDMLFGNKNSMAHFYKKQSSGKYALDGDVSTWVKLPYRESRYGYNKDQADGYWNYVKDSARAWYRSKVQAGWTNGEVKDYLARFDKWDRYDADGDGDFTESDGYIDHFQAIHAGEGEEAGAAPWAIWSHRWYAFPNGFNQWGPDGAKFGGVKIGKSGFWIGDYTTEPENGGLGVFAHEYGHDLGLADYYDTAGGDNGTGFWTIMSAGSWLNKGGNSIGTKPGFMGAHEKILLGWLDYRYLEYREAGRDNRVRVGPAERRGDNPQALVVGLPQASQTVKYNEPYSGNWEWWGGSADDLNSYLRHDFSLSGNTAKLTAWAWYDIEEGYDYLYGEVSTDNGATWKQVNPTGVDGGIDGSSSDWQKLTYNLDKFAGQDILFQFRYQTDTGVHYAGPFLDDITVTDGTGVIYQGGAENGMDGWTTNAEDGWVRTTGTETNTATQYYIAENRRYISYDKMLRTGPYNWRNDYTRPNWVERFPYQDGLLIWYWNNLYEDNNTSEHPGYGWALPVDSRPKPITFDDGSLLGNRRQPFDATFGAAVTDPVTFHRERLNKRDNVVMMREHVPARHQLELFNDTRKNRYWDKANPWGSVKVAGTGTRIKVLYESPSGNRMDLRVTYGAAR